MLRQNTPAEIAKFQQLKQTSPDKIIYVTSRCSKWKDDWCSLKMSQYTGKHFSLLYLTKKPGYGAKVVD